MFCDNYTHHRNILIKGAGFMYKYKQKLVMAKKKNCENKGIAFEHCTIFFTFVLHILILSKFYLFTN